MMLKPNPYDPPGLRFASGEALAEKYRTDYSRLTLREFCRASGFPILGIPEWIAIRLGFKRWQSQVFDAPRPMMEQLCEFDETPSELHAELKTSLIEASNLGYSEEMYTVKRSTGVEVVTVGVRMIHKTRKSFLSFLFARCGEIRRKEIQISAIFDLRGDFTTLSVTNEPLRFEPSRRCTVEHLVGASLNQLSAAHDALLKHSPDEPSIIENKVDIAKVVDTLTMEFFEKMIAIGAFIPHSTQTVG